MTVMVVAALVMMRMRMVVVVVVVVVVVGMVVDIIDARCPSVVRSTVPN